MIRALLSKCYLNKEKVKLIDKWGQTVISGEYLNKKYRKAEYKAAPIWHRKNDCSTCVALKVHNYKSAVIWHSRHDLLTNCLTI